MKVKFYYNHNYKSGTSEYFKVIGVLTTEGGAEHIFSVIQNKRTGNIEMHKAILPTYKKAFSIIHGTSGRSGYYGPCLEEHKSDFKKLVTEYLMDSFSALVKAVNKNDSCASITGEEYTLAVNEIQKEINEFMNVEDKFEGEEKWVPVPDNELNDDLINKILAAIMGRIEYPQEIDGVKYMLKETGNNEIKICRLEEGEKEVPETVVDGNVRKFIQMVKMINAEGLNNVVNGNFYPIVNTVKFNEKNFVTIKVGEEDISVSQNRIKLVNVFVDAIEKVK